MIKNLGLPYMGSKRKLASKIIDKIMLDNPNCKYFYDLFGGGGAVSFEAMQRGLHVTYNELNTGVVKLLEKIRDDGVTHEFYQWVDRETFNAHKNDDDWFGGMCKVVWSFGNNQKGYLFGKHTESDKKLGHDYVFNRTSIDGIPDCDFLEHNKRRLFLNKSASAIFKQKTKGNQAILQDLKRYKDLLNRKFSHETCLVFTRWLRSTGIKEKKVNDLTNSYMGGHYLAQNSQPTVPTIEHWNALKNSGNLNDIPDYINEMFSDGFVLSQIQKSFSRTDVFCLKRISELCELQHLENLQQLEQLGRLQQLEHLDIRNQSAFDVVIDTPIDETVIYLDPPYAKTANYQQSVCFEMLKQYIDSSPYAAYVSGYESHLPIVAEFEHRSILSATANNKVVERLYCNRPVIKTQEAEADEFLLIA